MWVERFAIIVPNLSHDYMPSIWRLYAPTVWDWATLFGSMGLFFTLFFLAAAFSDAIAVYMLSLCLDVDYYELREREYPLLAPQALAERVRKIHELFPPNPGFDFNIFYRRRTQT